MGIAPIQEQYLNLMDAGIMDVFALKNYRSELKKDARKAVYIAKVGMTEFVPIIYMYIYMELPQL